MLILRNVVSRHQIAATLSSFNEKTWEDSATAGAFNFTKRQFEILSFRSRGLTHASENSERDLPLYSPLQQWVVAGVSRT